jgi:hypothetical protein
MSNIIRRQRTTWTSVDNRVINDTRLGLKPLGLLIYMLSKPNDWQFNQEHLGRTWGEGREAMRSMMKTLQGCGYVRREYAHDEQGRIRTVTIVSELPEQPDLFSGAGDGGTDGRVTRQSGEPPVVNPTGGQPASIVKTDCDKGLRDKVLAQTADAACAGGPAKLDPEAVVLLPLLGGQEHAVTQDRVDAWSEAYPAVDVLLALKQMRAWCLDNTQRLKTKSGIGKFIVNWLTKEQNRGGGCARRQSTGPARGAAKPADVEARNARVKAMLFGGRND